MNVLVAGWFSFPEMGATAGDLLARDVVCEWLRDAGRPYDIAVAAPFTGGVDWRAVDPSHYSEVVFVCGPFGNGWPVDEFLARFGGRRFVGIDLSMLQPIETFNPFDVLLERDSSRTARPDISLLHSSPLVPVVGLVLVHRQLEYRDTVHDRVHSAIDRLVAAEPLSLVRIDTRLDVNATGLRSAVEVEALIARMDVVVTTRLHGLVLAVKHGVAAVAIDPVVGGAKVSRQAQALCWPAILMGESITDESLLQAYRWALTDEARRAARVARGRAVGDLRDVRERFIRAMDHSLVSTQG